MCLDLMNFRRGKAHLDGQAISSAVDVGVSDLLGLPTSCSVQLRINPNIHLKEVESKNDLNANSEERKALFTSSR